jgi:hypothetical protein
MVKNISLICSTATVLLPWAKLFLKPKPTGLLISSPTTMQALMEKVKQKGMHYLKVPFLKT